jgi:predicted RNase H-like HicB family nuclease
MMFRVVIEQDEDGRFVASYPTLPGCLSDGATIPEALRNIADAVEGVLLSMSAHNDPMPKIDEGEFLAAVEQLMNYHRDLEFLPAQQRLDRVTTSALGQARAIRQRVERSLGLPSSAYQGGLATNGDGLRASSTFFDLFTAVGSWLAVAREQNPEVFDRHFNPPPVQDQQFGFTSRRTAAPTA